MLGKRPGALKPTVIITCDDFVTKKKVEKIFKSQGWLQELLKANHMVFVALIAKTPLSAGPVSNNVGIVTLSDSYTVQIPSPEVPTSCGLNLLIQGVDSHLRQRSTLGGLLRVNGRVLGLTAGHPFARIKDNPLQRKLSEAAEDMDDFNDKESSSTSDEPFVFNGDSDDDENDDLVGLTVQHFEHTDTPPISIDEPAYDEHTISRSFLSMKWSFPQAAILPRSDPTNVSSIDNSLNDFDWALLESLPSSVNTLPNAISDADQATYALIEGIVSSPACGKVVIAAAGVGSQHGYLHNSSATMQVDRSVLDIQLVIMESILRKCYYCRKYVFVDTR